MLQRVSLGFAVPTVLLLALCLWTLAQLNAMSALFGQMHVASDQVMALSDVVEDTAEMRLAAFGFRARGAVEDIADVEDNANDLRAFGDGAGVLFADAPAAREAAARLVADAVRYRDAFRKAVEADSAQVAARRRLVAAAEAAEAALVRLRDAAAAAGQARIAAEAGGSALHLLHGRERVKLMLLEQGPGLADNARSAFVAALGAADRLRGPAEEVGFGAEARAAVEALSAAGAAFEDMAAAVARRDAAFRGDMDAIGPAVQTAAEAVLAQIRDRYASLDAAYADAMRRAETLLLAVAGAVLLLTALAAAAVARWIGGPLREMAAQMRRLAEGDASVEVGRYAAHRHELGEMSRALEVFRRTQTDLAAARAEREAAQRAAEAERRGMMGRLQASFGQVVDAGVAGDFGARVAADFPDPELNALAEAVNRLMQSADRGLGAAVAAMERLAAGDLGARMDGAFEGAFARLQGSVDDTVGRLAEVVEEIRGAAEEIAGAMKGMAGDADELSARTESQAASLEETAATMEQISATVRANAESARAAAALSREAAERADAGAGTMARTVEVIGRIEEGATRIAEITTVIDSIAFQTNLLALNAAVEAARAGEAGKGFAVVAAEVRGLAQRSAEAASDIKGLIETSGRQVGEGAEAARRAGAALDEIVTVVRRLDGAIAEITAAGTEQASGVEEISAAVASLDETTQRNAAAAQSGARAAAAVAETAGRLTALTGRFRPREGAVRARAA